MLSLFLALMALYGVLDALCAWHDAANGITGVYDVRPEFDHRQGTRAVRREDTDGAL